MFSRILAIFVVSLSVARNTESAPAVSRARQFLPALPGYVPVYIRAGDTPLEDINPDLAEAFHSYAQKHYRAGFGRASLEGQSALEDAPEDISVVEDLSLEEQNAVSVPTEPTLTESQHIQKIPRV